MFASAVYVLVRPLIFKAAERLSSDKASVNRLFTIPLIFAAALLSFARRQRRGQRGRPAGRNQRDPARRDSAEGNHPLWVMMVGALGIAIGLALYGAQADPHGRLGITELDQMRAFCIAMAAALTVIVATQPGLPVSSTHIGRCSVRCRFLREFLESDLFQDGRDPGTIAAKDEAEVARFWSFGKASVAKKGMMLPAAQGHSAKADLSKKERKGPETRLLGPSWSKRSALMRIVAAWLITVPMSGALAAILFFTIRGFMLPDGTRPCDNAARDARLSGTAVGHACAGNDLNQRRHPDQRIRPPPARSSRRSGVVWTTGQHITPVVESTGTGGGIKLFCAGADWRRQIS